MASRITWRGTFMGHLGSWHTPSVTLSFPQHGRRSSCDHVSGCEIVARGVPRIVIVLGSPTLDAPWTSSPTRSSCRGARFVRSVATSCGRSDTTSPRSPCQPQATSTRPSPVSPCRCPASAWSPTRCSCGGSGLEPCEHSCVERAPASAASTLGGCSSCIHSPRTCRSRTRSRGRTSCTGSLRLVRRR